MASPSWRVGLGKLDGMINGILTVPEVSEDIVKLWFEQALRLGTVLRSPSTLASKGTPSRDDLAKSTPNILWELATRPAGTQVTTG